MKFVTEKDEVVCEIQGVCDFHRASLHPKSPDDSDIDFTMLTRSGDGLLLTEMFMCPVMDELWDKHDTTDYEGWKREEQQVSNHLFEASNKCRLSWRFTVVVPEVADDR